LGKFPKVFEKSPVHPEEHKMPKGKKSKKQQDKTPEKPAEEDDEPQRGDIDKYLRPKGKNADKLFLLFFARCPAFQQQRRTQRLQQVKVKKTQFFFVFIFNL